MSDMAMLRIGIVVAGVLLVAAIFLFGRPKKPSQGRRIETTERDNARVEPSIAGDDTSEQVQDYSDARVSQPELGLPGGPARVTVKACSCPPCWACHASCASKVARVMSKACNGRER